MGFKEEITEIVRMTPKKRQTMLFSATLSDQVGGCLNLSATLTLNHDTSFNPTNNLHHHQVRKLAALSLRQPVRLAADAASSVPRQLSQQIVRLKVCRRSVLLSHSLPSCFSWAILA